MSYPELLDLPALVIERILQFLDEYDLMRLRLVCTSTKSWVETPEFLQHLENYPDQINEAEYNSAYEPIIRRSRFNIAFSYMLPYPSASYLKFLRIQEFRPTVLEDVEAINQCVSLESLSIHVLNLSSLETVYLPHNSISLNLKHLFIDHIWIRNPPGSELEYFADLLKPLVHLKSLRFPCIHEKNGFSINEKVLLSINYGFVIGPLIKYVARRAHLSDTTLQTLHMDNFQESFFELFPELVKFCHKTGTKMENVEYNLVKKLVDLRYDLKFLDTITSIRNFGPTSNPFTLSKVHSISGITTSIATIPTLKQWLPAVEEMVLDAGEIQHTTDNNVESAPIVNHTVKKLSLTDLNTSYLTVTFLSKLASCFTSLTVLKINARRVEDSDFIVILQHLKKLQTLDIEEESGGITDLGICSPLNLSHARKVLGDISQNTYKYEEADLFTLKDLKRLRISTKCKLTGSFYPSADYTNWAFKKLKKFHELPSGQHISDYSFIVVLRHLQVISFLVESADIHVTHYGYQALSHGSLASTVEYFPRPQFFPAGLSPSSFSAFQSQFQHMYIPPRRKEQPANCLIC